MSSTEVVSSPMSSIDFANDLNEEQLAAVTAPDGPVLVIAAAGTGKTRTLTYRVAYLVEKGIDASRILLLTFTNKAAAEMLERATDLVGESVGGLWGGTFHHMANRMLRRHADAIGYKTDYTILDQDDSRSLVRSCADELELLGKHFPKPDVLLSVFSYAANTENEIIDVAQQRFGHHQIDYEDVERVFKAYRDRKKALNAMDFDDLLVNAGELFRTRDEIRQRYQERFLYVLVDEYQDTNTIQAEWVDALAGLHKNLLVVGDDFQSIYSWRGADFRNIISFPKRFEGAAVFKLETNYRSVPEILDVANACIAGNPEQFQKKLSAVREDYKKPAVVRLRDGYDQARFVVSETQRLRSEGYRFDEMVVLYRSHFHAMELQLECTRAQVPYQITSGVRFFEQAHIKDVLTVPRLYANPADELAFARLLEMLPKVGRKTAQKIWHKLGHRFNPSDDADRKLVTDILPAAAKKMWAELETLFVDFAKVEKVDPSDCVAQFLDSFYDQYAVETFENYDRRVEDIQELVRFAAPYESAQDLLSEVALLTNLDAEADRASEEGVSSIRLSTIHQAKGLEWKVVFVLWLADSMFPSGRSMNERDGESEERRLFYVATTRAKDELYLCAPTQRRSRDGDVQYYSPSRFISEIPSELLEEVTMDFL